MNRFEVVAHEYIGERACGGGVTPTCLCGWRGSPQLGGYAKDQWEDHMLSLAPPAGTDGEEGIIESGTQGDVMAENGYVTDMLRGMTIPEIEAWIEDRMAIASAPASEGALRIAEERHRQSWKWSAGHDDGHRYGELAKVAAALAVAHTDATIHDPTDFAAHTDPWGLLVKHRHDLVRTLTIAGALIAAEIDRLVATGHTGEGT